MSEGASHGYPMGYSMVIWRGYLGYDDDDDDDDSDGDNDDGDEDNDMGPKPQPEPLVTFCR